MNELRNVVSKIEIKAKNIHNKYSGKVIKVLKLTN